MKLKYIPLLIIFSLFFSINALGQIEYFKGKRLMMIIMDEKGGTLVEEPLGYNPRIEKDNKNNTYKVIFEDENDDIQNFFFTYTGRDTTYKVHDETLFFINDLLETKKLLSMLNTSLYNGKTLYTHYIVYDCVKLSN
jgi:hypothetical protein